MDSVTAYQPMPSMSTSWNNSEESRQQHANDLVDALSKTNKPSQEELQWIYICIDMGSGVNNADAKGITPLHYACMLGDLKLVKYLCDRGANVRIADSLMKETPLHDACSHGTAEMVALLLNMGASEDLNLQNHEKSTPLYLACRDGGEKIVALLLERGALVNIADEDGYTPLHLAAVIRNKLLFKALLEAGADRNLVTNSGDTPLQLTKKNLGTV